MYIKLPDVYPYSCDQLRMENRSTSFPVTLSDSLLAQYGVYSVKAAVPPEHDPAVQVVEEASPVQIGGVWTQRWVVRNLTPEELKARIPTVVTMRQARLALLQSGLLSQVEAAIAAIEDQAQRQAVQIEWEYAAEVDMIHPWVQSLATALDLSEGQLDEFFVLAATL